MVIPIDRNGSRPVFRQIVDYLRRNIESGRLPPGTKLQPIRLLARALGVNRETVADAYRELETLGMTESGVGRGTFVLARTDVPRPGVTEDKPAPRRPFVPILSHAADTVTGLRLIDYTTDPHAVRLDRCVLDGSLYPIDELRRALNHVLRRAGRTLLDYGDPRGHEGLRQILVERLTGYGIETNADDIVLTAGSTQALALVAHTLCDPGDAVAVEEPAYPGAAAAFMALGLRPVAVPLGPDGMDLHALDTLLGRRGARLLYTMPTFHNPTGQTTSLEHRRSLLAIVARHGVAVLEDDFEKDMRVRGRPVPPLRALDGTGQVVYAGTFSKALFPGLRVGWIVGSRRVVEAATALKRATNLTSSTVLQAALAEFCRAGAYDRHLRKMVRELAARLGRAERALGVHLPKGSTFTRPDGGLTNWVTLPEPIDTLALLPEAKRAGVVYAPGTVFHPDGRRSSSLRLSVGQAGPDALERGIATLGEVARVALGRRRGRREIAAAQSIHV